MKLESSDKSVQLQTVIAFLKEEKFREAYSAAENLPDALQQMVIRCLALIGQDKLFMANDLAAKMVDIESAAILFAEFLIYTPLDPEDIYNHAIKYSRSNLMLLCLGSWILLEPEKEKGIWEKMLSLAYQLNHPQWVLIKAARLSSSLEEFVTDKEPSLQGQLQRLIDFHESYCVAPWYRENLEYEVAELKFKQADGVNRVNTLSLLINKYCLNKERKWTLIKWLFTLLLKEDVNNIYSFIKQWEYRISKQVQIPRLSMTDQLPQEAIELLLNLSDEYKTPNIRKELEAYLEKLKNEQQREYEWRKEADSRSPACIIDPVEIITPEPGLPVLLGASAPQGIKKGTEFTARFVAYVSSLEQEVETILHKMSPRSISHLDVKRCRWQLGTKIKVRLYGNFLSVNPSEEVFVWEGRMNIIDFDVVVSDDAPEMITVLKFDVLIDGIVVAKLRIDLQIAAEVEEQTRKKVSVQPIHTAFASYASEDRQRVLDRVAEIQRNGVNVFLDCLSIYPGEKWKPQLEEEIKRREAFLLFWSAYAKKSEMVTWEWRTALNFKGIDGIEPHPLCPISEAEPPEELKELHFGDVHMLVREALGRNKGSVY
jgi:hypothetical protein